MTRPDRVSQRYVCADCEGWQMIPVDPTDTTTTIGYYCERCGDVTDHYPDGKTDWYE